MGLAMRYLGVIDTWPSDGHLMAIHEFYFSHCKPHYIRVLGVVPPEGKKNKKVEDNHLSSITMSMRSIIATL